MTFGVALAALSMALCPTPAVAQQRTQSPVGPVVPNRGKSRPMTFDVPLVNDEQTLGNVVIEVTPPDDVTIDRQSLRGELAPLLNPDGLRQFDTALAGAEFVKPEALATIGIKLHFDQSQLELIIDQIAGTIRAVQTLGNAPQGQQREDLNVVAPATFSAYLNANVNYDYVGDSGGQTPPDLFLDGAARYKGLTVEYEGALTQQFGGNYRFYRHGIRAIYDQPGKDRRFSAGDIELDTISVLRTPVLGGIGVEKRSQIFNPYSSVSRLGGRQIFVDNRSTVDVLINGQKYQTLQLDPGKYDLSELPIQAGANDVSLRIRDSAGREQTIDYNYFSAPLDLAPGEDEYSFAIGMTTRDLFYEPRYTNRPAITGYYRRAFSGSFILGGAVQASGRTQIGAITASVVPQIIPGWFNIETAVSHSSAGTGTAVRAGYSTQIGRNIQTAGQLSVNLDYQGASYKTLGDAEVNHFNLLTVSANYSQPIDDRTYVSVGALYTRQGASIGNDKTVYVDVSRRISSRFRLTGGAEYGTSKVYPNHFGVRIGIAIAFGPQTQATANYRSRTDTFQADVSRGADTSHAGSWGYDVGLTTAQGEATGNASLEYVANRFDARASLFSEGDSFGNITDRQRARIQVGTSIAFADGAFGIGRPISDSFAVVHPHPSFGGKQIIAGRDLSDNKPYAASGTFGGAVEGDLSSYNRQDVQFDVDSAQPGFDIGNGTVRVNPPYRSGYNIVVGDSHFVSVVGNLTTASRDPVKLATGRITAVDDKAFEPAPFFTNSAGRFSILGLAPGKHYIVKLDNTDEQFAIAVPQDSAGLYKIGVVSLPSDTK